MDQKWQILNVFMPRLNTHWIQVKMAMFFLMQDGTTKLCYVVWIVKMLEEIYIEMNFHIGNLDLNKFPVMEFA